MSPRSLEDVLQAAGSPVELLRHSQTGPYAFPVVKPEFDACAQAAKTARVPVRVVIAEALRVALEDGKARS